MILMIPTSDKRTMENVGRFLTGDRGQGIKDLGTTDDLAHINIFNIQDLLVIVNIQYLLNSPY